MVTAALGIVMRLLGTLAILVRMGVVVGLQPLHQRDLDMIPIIAGGAVNLALEIVAILMGVFVLIGAIKMKNLSGYGLAMTAAIVAMIPCISPCCLLGLPLGIWALLVLADPSVKAAFRS